MKVALISDLHANLVALDTVLADIAHQQVEQIICLGDIVSLGPQPREVLARVRELNCPTIQGNHDPLQHGASALSELEDWTLEQMDEAELDYLRALPNTLDINLDGTKLLCVHGSPESYNDQVLATTDTNQLQSWTGARDFDVMVCGHTHVQLLRRIQARTIVGVGSVGMPFVAPFDGSTPPRILKCSEYALLSVCEGKLSVELRQLPLDFKAYQESVKRSTMPFQAWWGNQWV